MARKRKENISEVMFSYIGTDAQFEAIRSFDNITGFTHIFESVLPKLKARGVSEDEIHTLLVKNPARVFHGGYTY